jgi:serine/threonine protein kinase
MAQLPKPNREPDPDDGLMLPPGYKLGARIGAGAFGEVWRAEAPGGVEVAIKIIFRPLEHEHSQRELEALESIKRLRHPFLIRTQAFWTLADRIIIAMELADGSLQDRHEECLAAGLPGIPLDELFRYMREACEAFDYLHDKNVLHRDAKPRNILLIERHAKLADFGLATALPDRRSFDGSSLGTPQYMPPEVWQGHFSTHSDQYSLAVTYVELRLHRSLFPAGNIVKLMDSHLNATPILAPLGEAEQKVLLRALAKDPKQRYPACMQFWEELSMAALGTLSLPKSDGSVLVQPPQTPASSLAVTYATLEPGSANRVTSIRDPGIASPVPPAQLQDVVTSGRSAHRTGVRDVPGRSRRWGILAGIVVAVLVLTASAVAFLRWPRVGPTIDSSGDAPLQADFCPPGFRCDSPVSSIDGRKLCDRIIREWPDGMSVVFLLITQKHDKDAPPFYIMRDKVSNAVFRKFAEESAGNVTNSDWQRGGARLENGTTVDVGAGDDLPVMRVTFEDARRCAGWLGGDLPTTRQWLVAAGRYDSPGQTDNTRGPFDGAFVDGNLVGCNLDGEDIAIDRIRKGPKPIGTAPKDHSSRACRDMAGNGCEWTRTWFDSGDLDLDHSLVPLAPSPKELEQRGIHVLGADYQVQVPYLFDRRNTKKMGYRDKRPYIGFRVVIEIGRSSGG